LALLGNIALVPTLNQGVVMHPISPAAALTVFTFAMIALAAPTVAHAQTSTPPAPSSATTCPALLQQTFPRLQDERPQSLCQYAGKVVLVVNTASYCGFTPQYEGLEALYAKYAPRGLVVLGFPSNDFGQQEPGDDKQIADFCFNTFGVRFPMFGKSSVKGKDANPLHAALTRTTGTAPGWNFHKYLIDRQGRAIASFGSEVKPTSATLVAAVEKALAAK
jgi:glutathione peroxidase